MNIDIGETHIRLTTDLKSHDLSGYIQSIRADLKTYIAHNQDFLLSLEPLEMPDDDLSDIVIRMYGSSALCDVGPMACVAGTISEMALEYMMDLNSKYSIVENGGDIALVNDRKVLCGIYSNNEVLGNEIAFEIKGRDSPLGICTSSGKIGHSISFGLSDSVTVTSYETKTSEGVKKPLFYLELSDSTNPLNNYGSIDESDSKISLYNLNAKSYVYNTEGDTRGITPKAVRFIHKKDWQ